MDMATRVAARQGYRLRNLRDIWVEVSVDLDRSGPIDVVTDLDALSAAIADVALAGGFALRLRCEGGLCADVRLVVEDCALELGAALAEALGYAAIGLVFQGPPVDGRGSCLPAGLNAVFLDAFARALGARVESEGHASEFRDGDAATFEAAGRAIRAALHRSELLNRR